MTIRYRAGDLRTFAYNLLCKKGMQSDLAGTVANVLLEGDLLGHTTHGLQLLEPYLNEVEEKTDQHIVLIMLTNTFIHIQGIGAKTEQRLWNSGFREWDALSGDLPTPIPAGRKFFLEKGIEESRRHLANFNPAYFSRLIPSNLVWRMFPEFRNSTFYLDIETNRFALHTL